MKVKCPKCDCEFESEGNSEWPEFRDYARRKYPTELDEDLITMIEDLIERARGWEKPKKQERAIKEEKPIGSERARSREKPNQNERAR